MNNWFECKVSFDRIGEDGLIKKVTEPYLVDALSFTEAETRINKEVLPYASGDFMVSNIKRCKISEMVYNEEGDKWYRCRVQLLMLDENKGVEKKLPQTVMVQASNLKDAVERLIKCMEGSLGDYEFTSATETAILDVFPYEVPEN